MNKFVTGTLATIVSAITLFVAGYSYADAATTVVVKSGDTVGAIAKTYDVSIKSIKKANHLKDVNLIYVGQKLIIDGKAGKAGVKHHAVNNAANTNNNVTVNNNAQVAQAPAANTAPSAPAAQQPATNNQAVASDGGSAKAWIAQRESGGSYSARNGQYIGKYQLSAAYLNGDYSAANQERVANQYVANRYGSWEAAKSFWQSNGWY